MKENLTIGFIGNPNCGKTTLFNAYTGANLKVANWPGVTVEKVEGAIRDHNLNIRLVDLPGTYSLTSYTMEEQVSRQFILSDEVDMIIDVVDASALERNLYLTLQLLELGKPVVMALNMMDIVEKRGSFKICYSNFIRKFVNFFYVCDYCFFECSKSDFSVIWTIPQVVSFPRHINIGKKN